MIYLNSGRPGSGKTLNAIQRGMDWVREGRAVYALGINGLDEEATGIHVYNGTLAEWAQRLVPGDVLIVDEVQFFIKKGTTTRTVPEWVEELTRNRHHGIDMLWTTQDPKNIDPFLRRLVNEHRHFVNKFGGPKARVFMWHDGVEEPDSPAQRDRSEASDWPYPQDLYTFYKSAQLHTRKKRTPRKVKVLFGSLVACCVLVAGVYIVAHWYFSKPNPARSAGSALSDSSSGSFLPSSIDGSASKQKTMSKAEWIARQIPRVEGMPWSAPLFDDRKPTATPDIYCIQMEDIKCNCYTEQMTHLKVEFKMCSTIAHEGIYNPYRRQLERQFERPQVEQQQPAQFRQSFASSQPPMPVGPNGAPQAPQGDRWRSSMSDPYQPEAFAPTGR